MILPPGVDLNGGNTLVAFGNLAGIGAGAPVALAAGACFFAWGAWGAGTQLLLESSGDAGASWAPVWAFDGSAMSPYQNAVPAVAPSAGLYRVRLDVPFPGGVVNWACYQ